MVAGAGMGINRKRKRFRWLVKLVWTACFGLLLLSILLVLPLRWLAPPVSSFMLQWCLTAWRQGRGCHIRYQWVDWSKISPHMAIAVVAAEDQKFPYHLGFDFDALVEVWQEHQDGGRLRGASTISQQVAKNLYLWPGRSVVRKGLEAYFTVLIEVLWSKRRVLEAYLNVAEFGQGIFGVAAASDAFFGKLPAQLTAPEAALLAAVLPNPSQLHVERPSAYVLERRAWILRQMQQLGGLKYLQGL
jgi:monofunctional biosynthetic peptidoglycan transglycosylase